MLNILIEIIIEIFLNNFFIALFFFGVIGFGLYYIGLISRPSTSEESVCV